MLHEGADRARTDVVHGVGIADALRAVRVTHLRHDKPGVADFAMGGIREDRRQRNAVVVYLD